MTSTWLGESGPFEQPYYFRWPTRSNWDVTLFRNFPLGGDKRLQLRLGVFSLFGRIITKHGHRVVELAVRFDF